jgi:hypothetical protein
MVGDYGLAGGGPTAGPVKLMPVLDATPDFTVNRHLSATRATLAAGPLDAWWIIPAT